MKIGFQKLPLTIGFCMLINFVIAQNYLITDFGAKADTSIVNTEAINEAVTECHKNGGGKVIIPGGIFKTGTILMKDNVELHLENGATLLASTDLDEIPFLPNPEYTSQKSPGGWRALIYANKTSNISITGSGTIDGNGTHQKPHPKTEDLEGGDLDGRPRNILFISSNDILVKGIKMRNSGIWNQHYLNSEDITIDNINVYNHSKRNNDGIDIDGSKNVTISNSKFDTDDDGIVLKNTGPDTTENVAINNCIVSSHTNAIKAGTESTGGFRNITISNCIIKPSQDEDPIFGRKSGLSGIALEIADGGIMEGVTIRNITIEGTLTPIFVNLSNRARKYKEGIPEPSVGKMRNISLSNIVAYDSGNYTTSITGIPGHYIENISLSDIHFINEGGLTKEDYTENIGKIKEHEKRYPETNLWKYLPSSGLFIRHAKNVQINGATFRSKKDDPRKPIVAEDVEGLQIRNIGEIENNAADTFFYGKDIEDLSIDKPMGWSGKTKTLED